MNLFKKAGLGLALVIGSLSAGSASATTICNGCQYNPGVGVRPGTFLGNYAPGDNGSFTHTNLTGAFDDYYVFTVNPAGTSNINATFLLASSVTGFTVTMYATSAFSCASLVGSPATSGSQCSDYGILGPALVSGSPLGAGISVSPTMGSYVFRIQGTSTGTNQLYSGNILITALPEPGSLALVAVALMGAGLVARKKYAKA